MPEQAATLYLVCGKIASGKSTLCRQLAERENTLLLSEDDWLSRLFGPEMSSLQDYVTYSERLCAIMGPHVVSLLRAGLSVVLDFQANTLVRRHWMQEIYDMAGAGHELHYLDVPDSLCKERLRYRNETGTHEFAPTETQFDLITSYFEAPTEEEGFNLIRHSGDQV